MELSRNNLERSTGFGVLDGFGYGGVSDDLFDLSYCQSAIVNVFL